MPPEPILLDVSPAGLAATSPVVLEQIVYDVVAALVIQRVPGARRLLLRRLRALWRAHGDGRRAGPLMPRPARIAMTTLRRTVTFEMPYPQHTAVAALAREDGVSVGAWIRRAIDAALSARTGS